VEKIFKKYGEETYHWDLYTNICEYIKFMNSLLDDMNSLKKEALYIFENNIEQGYNFIKSGRDLFKDTKYCDINRLQEQIKYAFEYINDFNNNYIIQDGNNVIRYLFIVSTIQKMINAYKIVYPFIEKKNELAKNLVKNKIFTKFDQKETLKNNCYIQPQIISENDKEYIKNNLGEDFYNLYNDFTYNNMFPTQNFFLWALMQDIDELVDIFFEISYNYKNNFINDCKKYNDLYLLLLENKNIDIDNFYNEIFFTFAENYYKVLKNTDIYSLSEELYNQEIFSDIIKDALFQTYTKKEIGFTGVLSCYVAEGIFILNDNFIASVAKGLIKDLKGVEFVPRLLLSDLQDTFSKGMLIENMLDLLANMGLGYFQALLFEFLIKSFNNFDKDLNDNIKKFILALLLLNEISNDINMINLDINILLKKYDFDSLNDFMDIFVQFGIKLPSTFNENNLINKTLGIYKTDLAETIDSMMNIMKELTKNSPLSTIEFLNSKLDTNTGFNMKESEYDKRPIKPSNNSKSKDISNMLNKPVDINKKLSNAITNLAESKLGDKNKNSIDKIKNVVNNNLNPNINDLNKSILESLSNNQPTNDKTINAIVSSLKDDNFSKNLGSNTLNNLLEPTNDLKDLTLDSMNSLGSFIEYQNDMVNESKDIADEANKNSRHKNKLLSFLCAIQNDLNEYTNKIQDFNDKMNKYMTHFNDYIEGIKNKIYEFNYKLNDFINRLNYSLVNFANKIINDSFLKGLFDILDAIANIFSAVMCLLKALLCSLFTIVNFFTKTIPNALNQITQSASSILSSFDNFINISVQNIKDLFNSVETMFSLPSVCPKDLNPNTSASSLLGDLEDIAENYLKQSLIGIINESSNCRVPQPDLNLNFNLLPIDIHLPYFSFNIPSITSHC